MMKEAGIDRAGKDDVKPRPRREYEGEEVGRVKVQGNG